MNTVQKYKAVLKAANAMNKANESTLEAMQKLHSDAIAVRIELVAASMDGRKGNTAKLVKYVEVLHYLITDAGIYIEIKLGEMNESA